MPELSIVIVNYNTSGFTLQCLDSLRRNPARVSCETIVVDNASTDDSVGRLLEAHPEIRLVRSDRNRGIAGGNNLGIRAGTGKYVLLLNNDTLVLPGMIDLMADFLEHHPRVAAVGGRLVNPDGSFQSSFNDFPSLWSEFLSTSRVHLFINRYHPSYPDWHKARPVDWISSACLMLKRHALEAVGLIDESFFIYGDEPDLQYRIRRNGGVIYFLPEVTTIHYGGRSLDRWKRRDLVYRGKLLFFAKHYGTAPTVCLRAMIGFFSLAKLSIWGVMTVLPQMRSQAHEESASNMRVLRMCIQGTT